MQKIAIISDIHGNLPALKAVLKDIEQEYKTDEIYCLGDLVDSVPWHNEVIDMIRDLAIPTIMGNHDERAVTNGKAIPMPTHTQIETKARFSAIGYTQKTLTNENRAFMANFPYSIELTLGNTKCLLVHGSPQSNKQYIFEDHKEADLIEWFEKTGADIILTGHTHISYIRTVKVNSVDKLWVNVGSAGRNKELNNAKAVYLWLTMDADGIVTPLLRKIDYNVQKTIEGIKASPISDFYVDFFKKGLVYK